jgi:uncharacterized coiled-coil DUF342 family protein
MVFFDPTAELYRKFRKGRREFENPRYRGPERRLLKRRKMDIEKIIRKLEKEVQTSQEGVEQPFSRS